MVLQSLQYTKHPSIYLCFLCLSFNLSIYLPTYALLNNLTVHFNYIIKQEHIYFGYYPIPKGITFHQRLTLYGIHMHSTAICLYCSIIQGCNIQYRTRKAKQSTNKISNLRNVQWRSNFFFYIQYHDAGTEYCIRDI